MDKTHDVDTSLRHHLARHAAGVDCSLVIETLRGKRERLTGSRLLPEELPDPRAEEDGMGRDIDEVLVKEARPERDQPVLLAPGCDFPEEPPAEVDSEAENAAQQRYLRDVAEERDALDAEYRERFPGDIAVSETTDFFLCQLAELRVFVSHELHRAIEETCEETANAVIRNMAVEAEEPDAPELPKAAAEACAKEDALASFFEAAADMITAARTGTYGGPDWSMRVRKLSESAGEALEEARRLHFQGVTLPPEVRPEFEDREPWKAVNAPFLNPGDQLVHGTRVYIFDPHVVGCLVDATEQVGGLERAVVFRRAEGFLLEDRDGYCYVRVQKECLKPTS